MKMDEFLLKGSFMNANEKRYIGIPTEPEEMGVLEFNQFIRKINDPEQIAFSYKYLEIKKQFLASHKFNNARNKIKLTNKYLYSKYLQMVMLTQRMNKFIANMKEYFN